MPIPKKKQNEKQSAFMVRCVPQLMQYHPKEQAIAMCYKAFKGSKRDELDLYNDYTDSSNNNTGEAIK